MKIVIISLLFFFTINAQNVWYVDRDTPVGENGNGTSWATAWKYIGADGGAYGGINWASIHSGDTIYVSGGTDSTLYFPRFEGQPHYINPLGTYTFNPQVVIAPAWQAGHNGTVYLGIKASNAMTIFQIGGLSGVVNGVKVTGFTMIDLRNNPINSSALVSMWGERGTIDNCHIIGKGYAMFVGMAGYLNSITNNVIEDQWNELTFGQDMVGAGIGRGGFTITGNLMIVRNNYTMVSGTANSAVTTTNNSLTDTRLNEATNYHTPGITIHCNGKTMLVTSNSGSTFYGSGWSGGGNPGNGQSWYMEGAHRDGIQFSAFDGAQAGDNLENVVANNIFLDEGTRGTGWNSMIYTSHPACNSRFLIYNNIFCNKEEISSGGIFMYESEYSSYSTSIRLFNNTIINKGDGRLTNGEYTTGGAYTINQVDTLIMKNNLAVVDTGAKYIISLGYPSIPYKNIDYNIYAHEGYNPESFAYNDDGLVKTWVQWKTLGYDAHSDTMRADNVAFVNKYDSLATSYRTLTGHGEGVDLSSEYPFLRYDINGNDRGSSWDIGAIQYDGTPPGGNSGINLKSKIFLQGPFNNNSMLTNLSQNGFLPISQPFNTAPWNYNGSETLTYGTNSGYVDWVLIELRNSSNPAQVVSRKAAILKNDGTLLNTDGSTGVPFSNVQEGSYYIAVFQRNHLAIMSAAPVQLTAASQIYDFTTGMNKAYGTDPMADLGGGKFGMYAGDGNSNGGITITDRNDVWFPQNGTIGYLKGDFNLDGGVTVSDVNLFWNINNGTMTQVP